jgi:hypothetical protein
MELHLNYLNIFNQLGTRPEVGDLKKMSFSGVIKVPPEVKLKRYHALLNRAMASL